MDNADKEVEICDDSSDTFLALFLVEWLNSKMIFSFSLGFLTLGVELSISISLLQLFLFFLFLSFCNNFCNFCRNSSRFWFSLVICLCIKFCSLTKSFFHLTVFRFCSNRSKTERAASNHMLYFMIGHFTPSWTNKQKFHQVSNYTKIFKNWNLNIPDTWKLYKPTHA